MKRLILLFVLASAVIGYSQDTIVTAKKIYVGKIISCSSDGYVTITSDVDVMSKYRSVYFNRIIEFKTNNEEIKKAFDKCIYVNSEEYKAITKLKQEPKYVDISKSTINTPAYSSKSKDEFSSEYNVALYDFNKFNAQRKGGKGAMIGGGALAVAGGVMAGIGKSQGLTIAGSVVAGAGGLSFLVGLFCWIDGQIKYYNSKNELNLIKFKRSSISTDGAKVSLNF